MASPFGRILDSIVGAFDPAAGARRTAARNVADAASVLSSRHYEMAKPGRRQRSWNRSGGSARALIGPQLPAMRNASRELVRNNPYGRSSVRVQALALVRYGITPKPIINDTVADAAAEHARLVADWNEWIRLADADGVSDFYGMQYTMAWQLYEAGEVFVRMRTRDTRDAKRLGLAVPLQLQVLESDQLPCEDWTTPSGNRVLSGIELDSIGRRVAYHFFERHPGDPEGSLSKVRVPVDQVCHLFICERPGQMRGVPTLASVGGRLYELDVYMSALLARAQVEAACAAFVKRDVAAEPGQDGIIPDPAIGEVIEDDGEGRLERLEPGSVNYLDPGEEIIFNQPQSSGGLEVFARETLRAISVGAGVPYELVTGDLSQVTYVSFRAGSMQFRAQTQAHQWLNFIPQVLTPVWMAFCKARRIAGRTTLGIVPVGWGVPKPDSVDPLKDVEADVAELNAGLASYSDKMTERGSDWREVIDEIANIEAYAATKGLRLAPGKFGPLKSGQTETPADPAASTKKPAPNRASGV